MNGSAARASILMETSPPSPGSPPKLPEMVAFEKITKTFGEGPDAKIAIQDVSFVVEDLPNTGELITIVGPSGCGKSTLLRIIAGLVPPFPATSGQARVFGKPVGQPDADRGLVDQKYSLLPHLTVLHNIAFGLKLRDVPRKERLAPPPRGIVKVGL